MNSTRSTATVRRSLLGAIALALLLARAGYSEEITLYSYHNHPPFVTGHNSGLTYELLHSLNRHFAERYHFQLQLLPRRRLNVALNDWLQDRCGQTATPCPDNWAIAWVNPSWGFGELAEQRFLWLELFRDANLIISHRERPVDYREPQSLAGLRFGGIGGHRYTGIDELVASGAILRIDGNYERDNIIKLLSQRIDATLLPRSAIDYLMQHDPIISKHRDELYIAPQTQQDYQRYLMMPGSRSELQQAIAELMAATPLWQTATPASHTPETGN